MKSHRTWESFRRFDEQNPQIWELFVRFTQEKIARGFKHYGARDVIHRIRWETGVWENGGGGSGFKINDHWSSWYARKFHESFPTFDGFFRVRPAKADERWYDDPRYDDL